MTILDELAALARERHYGHYGHGERALITAAEMALCRVSKIPIDWCGGCKKGHHRRAVLEHSLREGIEQGRDPDFCPRCTPLYGSCRCEIAASE